MSKVSISLNMNVDLNTLFDQISKKVGNIIKPNGASSTSPNSNDRFVSLMTDDQVVACYFHPTKKHYATSEGKTKPGRSYAEAGQWAVAVAMRALMGNKTYYGSD